MIAQPLLPAIAPKVDSKFITESLCRHYTDRMASQGRYVCFAELRTSTGYSPIKAQSIIDLWAMDLWPSGDLRRIAFEVKISRGDFLRELKDPRKRKYALLWSNEFLFATPEGLVDVAELPPEAGLVEVRDDGSLCWRVAAPWRDTPAPSWRFFAAVARRVAEGRAITA
jgi:hypothetical protein